MTTFCGAARTPGAEQLHLFGGAIVVIAFATPVFMYRVGARQVSSIVEERVAITAREMWRAGEWILPTMNGAPRLQKPPLVYWLPQLAANVRSEFDDLTLRLPFAVLAIATLLAIFGTGVLRLGPEGGIVSAVVLLTSPLFIKAGRTAAADGVLLFCTACALFFHVLARRETLDGAEPPRAPRWPRIAFFLCLGLGSLAKGPVILAVTLLPILLEAAVTRSRKPIDALWSPSGLAVFVFLSAVWPVAVLWRLDGEPAVLHHWVLESFGKVLPSAGVEDGYEYLRHPKPWYYYISRLAPAFGVWIVPLAFVVCRRLTSFRARESLAMPSARSEPARSTLRMSAIWFTAGTVFFSLVSEKKSMYMLPLMPAGALMIASIILVEYKRFRHGLRRLAAAGAVAALLALVLLFVLLFARSPELVHPLSRLLGGEPVAALDAVLAQHPGMLLFTGGCALVGFSLLWRLSSQPRPLSAALVLGSAVAIATMPCTDLELLLRRHKLSRSEALTASALMGDRQVYCYGDGIAYLPGGTVYYLDRPLEFLGSEPGRLQDLPLHAELLVYSRFLRHPGGASTGERSTDLEDAMESYAVVSVINPEAKERDRVLLLEKRS